MSSVWSWKGANSSWESASEHDAVFARGCGKGTPLVGHAWYHQHGRLFLGIHWSQGICKSEWHWTFGTSGSKEWRKWVSIWCGSAQSASAVDGRGPNPWCAFCQRGSEAFVKTAMFVEEASTLRGIFEWCALLHAFGFRNVISYCICCTRFRPPISAAKPCDPTNPNPRLSRRSRQHQSFWRSGCGILARVCTGCPAELGEVQPLLSGLSNTQILTGGCFLSGLLHRVQGQCNSAGHANAWRGPSMAWCYLRYWRWAMWAEFKI